MIVFFVYIKLFFNHLIILLLNYLFYKNYNGFLNIFLILLKTLKFLKN